MPGRRIPFVTNEIYHVFNRGNNRQPTFSSKRDYQRAIESIRFYKVISPPIKLSKFLRLENQKKTDVIKIMQLKGNLVTIFAFCLMPNHFHFLIKQEVENGISRFLSNFQNSYTRYYNVKHERDGSLFLDQFKAVRVETDEQFIHLSRYIHLNPYTGFVVKSTTDLDSYPWSSFMEYSLGEQGLSSKEMIISMFKNSADYKKFVYDQADYQRSLKLIEHLTLEFS